MLVRQVLRWYFHSVDLHPHVGDLGEQVNITRAEIRSLCESVTIGNPIFICPAHSHVGDLHVDVFPFDVIFLQQDNEFQLVCTVLGQNLVAGLRHLGLVPPVVEGGQRVPDVAALSCKWR